MPRKKAEPAEGAGEPGLKFEEALEQLEAIVARLEGGELPLDEALRVFEEGVRLTKLCSQRLSEAERRIAILVKNASGALEERPFTRRAEPAAAGPEGAGGEEAEEDDDG
jgi:exodeoxyribonuclease VII small subunit